MAASNWRSDWRKNVIDLTTDEGNDDPTPPPIRPLPWASIPLPGSHPPHPTTPASPHYHHGQQPPPTPLSNVRPYLHHAQTSPKSPMHSVTMAPGFALPPVSYNHAWTAHSNFPHPAPNPHVAGHAWVQEPAAKKRKLSVHGGMPEDYSQATPNVIPSPSKSAQAQSSEAETLQSPRPTADRGISQSASSIASLPYGRAAPLANSKPFNTDKQPIHESSGQQPATPSQQPQHGFAVPDRFRVSAKTNGVVHGVPSGTPTHAPRIQSMIQTPAPATPSLERGDFLQQRASAESPLTLRRTTGAFTEQEQHLLIFLKEIKKFSWKKITEEFQKDYPDRTYTNLQSRYSTKINKRDRSLDPHILKLPSRWAAEAVIDWNPVHATNPRPRAATEVVAIREAITPKPRYEQTSEAELYSGTESDQRQHRPRRAPRVNYDVRKRVKEMQQVETSLTDDDRPSSRDFTPLDDFPVPPTAIAVDNEPIVVDFDGQDATFAFATKSNHSTIIELPYLSATQQRTVKKPPQEWNWDQLYSREYQGSVIHVDFSSEELAIVEKLASKIIKAQDHRRHSTIRRRFRSLLKRIPEPGLTKLAYQIHKLLPLRNSHSIAAFLEDAVAGKLSESPRIQRLAAAKPLKTMSSFYKDSTTAILRQRELGLQSRRGWKSASTAVTYQIKNKLMDSMGPVSSWTGASSDIHTVAWSPDGSFFAAGAVAVTDPDSMQYNRPNNLLFGNTAENSIYELAEHWVNRKRTESGANSSHAMYMSQDPNLYTTVTSVAFSPRGDLMYSGGYDESICIWRIEPSSQPTVCIKLRHKAEIEMMAVNPRYHSMVATAAKRASSGAVKLLTFDVDKVHDLDTTDPAQFRQHAFHSEKAASRADLCILPQALRFEPIHGRQLLAGFGANARQDGGFDVTGDLCLWDVDSATQLAVHGNSRNVFDVAFNPVQGYGPTFAAGCVASSVVNRGTRSVIRLYDYSTHNKYTCPIEIECKALDINDVVWCPHDENLISAGCTDGRIYVWDIRRPKEPIRILSHGASLMPLQDGEPHERTDTGVRFLSWGENATRLYSGSSDGVVKTWDVTRAIEDTFIKDIITTDSGIMSGSFSSDFTKLVLGEVNGSVNVLEVGRDEHGTRNAQKLRYVPYDINFAVEEHFQTHLDEVKESGVAEGSHLLETQQLQLTSMGNLPVRQVIQGPNYQGPHDQSVDAPFLREQAMQFQLSMAQTGPQCDISACRDNIVKVTSEEVGDSKRGADRIPDELRLQWKVSDPDLRMLPGKTKCTHCGRPARPSLDDSDPAALCERCSFACFRCGASNPVAPSTTTLICDSCAGIWDIGVLGYECISQPSSTGEKLGVAVSRKLGREILEERFDDDEATFGDEMNALTDYYFSLAIDRPQSPPL